MQTNNLEYLSRTVKPDDYVYVTFGIGVDEEVVVIEGTFDHMTVDEVAIMQHRHVHTFGTWQMLSLLCQRRDISFIRENSVYYDLERLSMRLGERR